MDGSRQSPREAALRRLMDEYCQAWNREDLDAIVESYHLPCFIYKYGTLHALLDAESKRDYIAGFIQENREAGPATWEFSDFSMIDLGSNSSLATARWVFRRPDGSVVWEFVDSHQFCQFNGRWRFLTRTLHDGSLIS
jgi:hypothetical protein